MKIVKQEFNPLLERKQVEIELEHEGNKTPSNQEVKKLVSEHFKVSEDLTVIKHIYTKFGGGISKVFAYVYENKDFFNSIEIIRKSKKKKDKKSEAKKEEAK